MTIGDIFDAGSNLFGNGNNNLTNDQIALQQQYQSQQILGMQKNMFYTVAAVMLVIIVLVIYLATKRG